MVTSGRSVASCSGSAGSAATRSASVSTSAGNSSGTPASSRTAAKSSGPDTFSTRATPSPWHGVPSRAAAGPGAGPSPCRSAPVDRSGVLGGAMVVLQLPTGAVAGVGQGLGDQFADVVVGQGVEDEGPLAAVGDQPGEPQLGQV